MAKGIARSKDEMLAEIDQKIATHNAFITSLESACAEKVEKRKASIAKLEARKENILNPKPRKRAAKKVTAKSIIAKAKEMGLSEEEIAAKLGVSIEPTPETPEGEGEE